MQTLRHSTTFIVLRLNNFTVFFWTLINLVYNSKLTPVGLLVISEIYIIDIDRQRDSERER